MNEQWEKFYYSEYLPGLSRTVLTAYDHQQTASWIVLTLVSLLCISGVVLAYLQLYWSKESLKGLDNQLSITSSGVKIVSPFVGVLILGLSFSFFYLYIKDVYAIRVVEDSTRIGATSPQQQTPRSGTPPY